MQNGQQPADSQAEQEKYDPPRQRLPTKKAVHHGNEYATCRIWKLIA
jgi:hypothetical protein